MMSNEEPLLGVRPRYIELRPRRIPLNAHMVLCVRRMNEKRDLTVISCDVYTGTGGYVDR